MSFLQRLALALASLVLVVVACHQPSVLEVPATRLSDTKAATLSNKPIGRSLFGMHIGSPDKIPWPTVPIASWRFWDVGGRAGQAFWAHLEPQKGKWDFRTLDDSVELAQRHGVEILYTLGIAPKWAAARPNDGSAYGDGPTASEPKNIEDWRNYIKTVATRYKGKIRYYEIWNEPNLKHFFSGTPEQMVTLAREAYTVLKEIDPSIQVVSPGVFSDYGGWNWLDEYLGKGGKTYADIIGAHFYANKTPEETLSLIHEVQKVMEKHGLAQKPLWNTETGFGNKQERTYFSEEDSMAYVAKSYILNWAAGIERFYWYAWDNRNVVTILMVKEDNTTLTPAAKAYDEIQKWLVGSRLNKCEPDSKSTWTCDLIREDGKPVWIVWNSKGVQELKVPETFDVRQVHSLNGEKTALPDNRLLKIGSLPVLLSRE
jgi:hypothetical protein